LVENVRSRLLDARPVVTVLSVARPSGHVDAVLAQAKRESKPLMLDFSAAPM